MDTGAIFYILFGPALFVLAAVIIAGINLLIRAIIAHLAAAHRRRSEHTYVQKHQRDNVARDSR